MTDHDYQAPPSATAREIAVEALLTDKALWGLLGCVLLIVITMCTTIEAHLAWYPVTLDIQGFLALGGMSITTIMLRNKALDGGSEVLTLLAVLALCSLPLLVGLYSTLYAGAFGLVNAALALNGIDATVRLLCTLAGVFIVRDTLRLLLAVRTFSLHSPLIAAMESDAEADE